MNGTLGLVLTSGGARGAYQAGALRALAEITRASRLPFQVLSGVSAGSINSTYLACQAGDFQGATERLARLWSTLRPRDIFLTDGLTLTRTGMAWISDLGFGAWIGSGRGKSLLVTSPLQRLLGEKLDFGALRANIATGLVRGVALTATNYSSGTSVTFYDGTSDIEPWTRTTRMAVREQFSLEHVMASSAIPVFFPAVRVGGAYYGDGCIRMSTPLSPAIHLGADKVLAIGVRHERSVQRVADLNGARAERYPLLADVGGVLLNAMFLDALESDVERMERINQTLSLIPESARRSHPSKLRQVPVMVLKPTRDLGELVAEVMKDFPFAVRHFLKGLGTSSDSGYDLMSYLAFDSAYTARLEELGYRDTMAAKDAVTRFLELPVSSTGADPSGA
ncbi:MAG: patatin-like phospholipase family protein [Deltaproteobacteria bacterium]|nr:patatin-like phospholipase family protein [Deltaproteobacteria bacterium]